MLKTVVLNTPVMMTLVSDIETATTSQGRCLTFSVGHRGATSKFLLGGILPPLLSSPLYLSSPPLPSPSAPSP